MLWQLLLEFWENVFVASSHPLKSHLEKVILENSSWLEKSPRDITVQVGETGGDGRLEEDDDSGDKEFSLIQILYYLLIRQCPGSSTARSLTTFFLELVVTLIFVLVSYTLSYPKQAAVIFLSFLIIYLMLTVIS